MKGSQCDRRGNNSGEYEWRANRHGMGEFSNVLLLARACLLACLLKSVLIPPRQ